jgi:hypothetical protein
MVANITRNSANVNYKITRKHLDLEKFHKQNKRLYFGITFSQDSSVLRILNVSKIFAHFKVIS